MIASRYTCSDPMQSSQSALPVVPPIAPPSPVDILVRASCPLSKKGVRKTDTALATRPPRVPGDVKHSSVLRYKHVADSCGHDLLLAGSERLDDG